MSQKIYIYIYTHTHTHIYMYIWSIKIRKPFFPTKKMQGNDIKKKSEQLHLFPCLDVFHTYPHAEFSIFQYLGIQVAFFHSSQNKGTLWNWMLTHYRFTMVYYCYLDVIFLSLWWILECPSLSSKILSSIQYKTLLLLNHYVNEGYPSAASYANYWFCCFWCFKHVKEKILGCVD